MRRLHERRARRRRVVAREHDHRVVAGRGVGVRRRRVGNRIGAVAVAEVPADRHGADGVGNLGDAKGLHLPDRNRNDRIHLERERFRGTRSEEPGEPDPGMLHGGTSCAGQESLRRRRSRAPRFRARGREGRERPTLDDPVSRTRKIRHLPMDLFLRCCPFPWSPRCRQRRRHRPRPRCCRPNRSWSSSWWSCPSPRPRLSRCRRRFPAAPPVVPGPLRRIRRCRLRVRHAAGFRRRRGCRPWSPSRSAIRLAGDDVAGEILHTARLDDDLVGGVQLERLPRSERDRVERRVADDAVERRAARLAHDDVACGHGAVEIDLVGEEDGDARQRGCFTALSTG